MIEWISGTKQERKVGSKMTESRRNGSLKSDIYQFIYGNILGGQYLAGSIINEKELITAFHVSKSPVREALLELCHDGILRSIPRYGYEVIRMTQQDEKNVREYRMALESSALDLFWDRIQLNRIEELLHSVRNNSGKLNLALDQWLDSVRFHLALNYCLRNEYTYNKLEEDLNIQTRVYNQFILDRWHRELDFSPRNQHEEILTAILQGDREQAVMLLKQNISHSPLEAEASA